MVEATTPVYVKSVVDGLIKREVSKDAVALASMVPVEVIAELDRVSVLVDPDCVSVSKVFVPGAELRDTNPKLVYELLNVGAISERLKVIVTTVDPDIIPLLVGQLPVDNEGVFSCSVMEVKCVGETTDVVIATNDTVLVSVSEDDSVWLTGAICALSSVKSLGL